ncbi:hypothetical protein C8J56DRAFT_1083542 [Mycena floridula]|nr:hypothetical protein C8J56DRAFT_1083542 [Mycena floridula]
MASSRKDTGLCLEDNTADNRIAVSCSSCAYEFILKPLPSLLHSHSTRHNVIPHDTQAIQLFIADAEGEVTRCNEEILRLREIIEKVEKHQAQLTNEITIHQSFIAPNHPSAKGKENISGSRITATCSSCAYEFISKPLSSVVDSLSTRQNIILSDAEAIQSFIIDVEEEVTRCSQEVSHLRAVIDEVENRQSEINHEISIHRSFMAPIRRLPPELLALVFSFFCTVDFWDCEPFKSKRNRMTGSLFREPFIIATVCSHWRSIALSTPSLWSTIMLGGIFAERWRKDCEANALDVFGAALERSAQHPLKLWTARVGKNHWSSIFTTRLRQICSRVEQIYLGGDTDPFHLPDSPSPMFDRLSAVQVSPNPRSSMGRLPWLSTASNLRVLILQNVDRVEAEFWTDLPVQSTQFLLFQTRIPMLEAMEILTKFPNITSSGFSCEFSDYVDLPFAWKAPQALHHLDVTLSCYDRLCNPDDPKACHCLGNLLSSINTPGLKSLRLQADWTHFGACWSRAHFSRFLKRSAIKQSLTSLCLQNIDGLDDNKLANLFHSVPFLTRLTVSTFRNEPIIRIPMLCQLGTTSLLPRLKFFDVKIDDTADTVDAVVNLVKLRSGPAGLEEIVVRLEGFSETMGRLEEGMKLNFTGARYTIAEARLYADLPNEWVDEIQRV